MLKNYGFRVVDLGKDVPKETSCRQPSMKRQILLHCLL